MDSDIVAAEPQRPGGGTEPVVWTVAGIDGQQYRCPDLDTLDQHLRLLRTRQRNAQAWAGWSEAGRSWAATFCDDIDRLLDLRWFLQTNQEHCS